MVGIQGTTSCFLTLVERKTGFLVARKLMNRKSATVLDTFEQTVSKKTKNQIKSITFDNGVEFALHSLIEYEIHAPIYFAHPYCSSERGTNENTNGLIRQYFPKKTDLSIISEIELQRVIHQLNHSALKVQRLKMD